MNNQNSIRNAIAAAVLCATVTPAMGQVLAPFTPEQRAYDSAVVEALNQEQLEKARATFRRTLEEHEAKQRALHANLPNKEEYVAARVEFGQKDPKLPPPSGIIRVVPRDDYGHRPEGQGLKTSDPVIKSLSNFFLEAYNAVNDRLNTVAPLLDLQWNMDMGGNNDIVYQLSQDRSRLEVFVCPSLRSWDKERSKYVYADASHSNLDRWACDQVYSAPATNGTAQAEGDYNWSRHKRVILDFIVDNALGYATIGQVAFLNTGIVGLINNILGAENAGAAVYDYVRGSAKADGVPVANNGVINSPDGKILVVKESAKYGLVSQQMIWRTRNQRGGIVDSTYPVPNLSELDELSLGDRYRHVQMYPQNIENGWLRYEVTSGLNYRSKARRYGVSTSNTPPVDAPVEPPVTK